LVAAVLPALFVLGWFTVVRLVDTSVGSYRVQEAIAHIRGFYRQLTPEAPYYFPVWQGTDEEAAEALAMLGTKPRRSTVLFTTAGMVAAINSLVGGVGVALLTNEALGHGSDVPAVVAGCGFGVACLAVASIYQLRRYQATAAEETRRWARQ
jgi:hypothetical protein